jgi:transporter family-2 protein
LVITFTDKVASMLSFRLVDFGVIVVALLAGSVNTLQLALLTGIRGERGPLGATWISMLASLGGMALLLGGVLLANGSISLPSPFTNWWIFAILGAGFLGMLVLAGWGLPWYLLVTGALSIPYLIAAAWAGQRIGLGVYLATVVTGQLATSVMLDHIGAFGLTQRSIDPLRMAGVLALIAGVLLIRGRG